LDAMVEHAQHARAHAVVLLVHEDRAALEQIAIGLERQVQRRVEQRMARTDEGCERLTVLGNEPLFENDPLIALEDRFADANLPVPTSDDCRYMRHLVTPALSLAHSTAEAREGLEKERFDVVRLQPASVGALHVLAHAL